MDPHEFSSGVGVREEDLAYEPFRETRKIEGFDSGSPPLDEFLTTEEVATYEAHGLGTTTLVFNKGELVAYYTVATDRLSIDRVKRVKSFSRYPPVKVEDLPAIKIGRLAVQKHWQGRGIGRLIIRHIAGEALALRGKYGVRLLVLHAKPGSIPFYEKLGFVLVDDRRDKKRTNRTMFFDLQQIVDVA